MSIITSLTDLHGRTFDSIERATDGWLLSTLARLVFAATLLIFFWNSALTKLGDGLFGFLSPSSGAYIQILPKAFEAAGYDSSAMSFHHHLIVLFGMWGEFIIPALVVLGLFTRLSALAMIGFVIVMSIVDVTGHGADATTIGAWFDRDAYAVILDQRAWWVLGLLILVIKGGGPLSIDGVLARR